MPFKGKKPRGGRAGHQGQQRRGGHQQQSYKKRKPKHQNNRGAPPDYGRKETVKEEDSPFAALAALKKDLPKDKS